MALDFRKTSLDYNWGFIDGIMWVAENRNKIGFDEMFSMVESIWKVNDEIISEDEKRFEHLQKQNLKTKTQNILIIRLRHRDYLTK